MNDVAAATDVALFFLGSAKTLNDGPGARTLCSMRWRAPHELRGSGISRLSAIPRLNWAVAPIRRLPHSIPINSRIRLQSDYLTPVEAEARGRKRVRSHSQPWKLADFRSIPNMQSVHRWSALHAAVKVFLVGIWHYTQRALTIPQT
jgi:hypothetical protein